MLEEVAEAMLTAVLKLLDAASTRLLVEMAIASTRVVGAIGTSIASTRVMKKTADFNVSYMSFFVM